VNPTPSAASLRLRFFGIPVAIQPAFFIIVGLLGWAGSLPNLLIWIGVAFVSILLHELGHALTARSFGSPTSIVIYGFGGLTSHQHMSVRRDLAVTLAGPGAGLVVGALVLLIARAVHPVQGSAVHVALAYALWINIGWSLINLLPILPLDGGNAMRGIVHLVSGQDRELLVRQTSIAVAVVGGIAAFRFGLLFTVFLALFFIGDNMRALRTIKDRGHATRLRAAESQLNSAPHDAVAMADQVLNERPDHNVSLVAHQLKAWALLRSGDIVGAQTELAALPEGAVPSFHLQAALQFAQGDADRGLAFAVEGFRRSAPGGQELVPYVVSAGQVRPLIDRLLRIEPEFGLPAAFAMQVWLHQAGRYAESVGVAQQLGATPGADHALVAYNAACSCAQAARPDDACEWLQRALDSGFADAHLFETDTDLEPLRTLPRFAELESRVRAGR
jgi:Zn-dependent protease